MSRARGKERSREQVLADRAEIAQRYLHGETQAQIGQALGYHWTHIGRELRKIREAWLDSSLVDFNAKKAEHLAKIDHLEMTAWTAWERSVGLVKKTTQYAERNEQGVLVPMRATVTTEESPGNDDFLRRVQECLRDRADVFGFAAPKQFKITEQQQEIEKLLEEYATIATTHSPEPDASPDSTLH